MTARRIVGRGLHAARDLGAIAVGRADIVPDRRFSDPAWTGNRGYRRLAQTYLTAARHLDGLIADAGLGWRSEEQLRFGLHSMLAALAPTNFPLTNPEVLKAALDTGGGNFIRGLRHLLEDVAKGSSLPAMVDGSTFTKGENIAATAGAVVQRTPVYELIQYRPLTKQVLETPLLVVPPMINKYYVADLAPGRSMIEDWVRAGQHVFAISWRNPAREHADWNLDTYAAAVRDALDAVCEITGAQRSHALGICAGGIVLSALAAHLAARGSDRLAGIGLLVSVLAHAPVGLLNALTTRVVSTAAIADVSRRGYVDGDALGGIFAWLRPTDLVWTYWVNNYLLGKTPPAFDILYWNADTTRLPAGVFRDFVEISLHDKLAKPGELTVLGTPIDLREVTVDAYVMAGVADHLAPWQSCYRTTQLLGGSTRFVLSNSGHIAAMINPRGNPKASFWIGDGNPADPDAWRAGAVQQDGSWWSDWTDWLAARSGATVAAPEQLGGGSLRPLADAPGTYIHDA